MDCSYLNYLEGQIRLFNVHNKRATARQHIESPSPQTEARGTVCLPIPLDRQRSGPSSGALDGAIDSNALENSLIGDMAQLVLSPSGTHRKPSLPRRLCHDD